MGDRALYRLSHRAPLRRWPDASERVPTPLVLAAVAVGVACSAALVFPSAFVGGDMVFALIWGDQLLHGDLTSFWPGPTPHPLPIAWGALVSPLGEDAAYRMTQVVWGYLSLGAVVAISCGLVWRLWSAWGAVLTASILLTSGPIAAVTFQTGYDLAFAALVLAALYLEMFTARRPSGVLMLLALAGLIRPEAWVLAGAYWLWSTYRAGWRERAAAAALVGLAPILWTFLDALVTGDPLWSLHITEAGSEELYRQYTPAQNLVEAGRDLARYLGPLALALGGVGIVWLGHARPRALVPAAALLALSLGTFASLTLAGMASNTRYLLLPACLVAVAAGALAGRGRGRSTVRTAVALAASVLLLVQAIGRADHPGRARGPVENWAAWTREAHQLVGAPGARSILDRCDVVAVPSVRMVASFSYVSGRAPARWISDRSGRTRPQAYLAPAAPEVARTYLTRRRFVADAGFAVPSGLRRVAGTQAWSLYASSDAACVRQALRRY